MRYPLVVTFFLCLSLSAHAAPVPGGAEEDLKEIATKLRQISIPKLTQTLDGKVAETKKWTNWQKLALTTLILSAIGNGGYVVSGVMTADHLGHQKKDIEKLKHQMSQVQGQQQQDVRSPANDEPGTTHSTYKPSSPLQKRALVRRDNTKAGSEIEELKRVSTENEEEFKSARSSPLPSFRKDAYRFPSEPVETLHYQSPVVEQLRLVHENKVTKSVHDDTVSTKVARLEELQQLVNDKEKFFSLNSEKRSELKVEAAKLVEELKLMGLTSMDAVKGLPPFEKTLAIGNLISSGILGIASATLAIDNSWVSNYGPVAKGIPKAGGAAENAAATKHQ